ncbi:MAG: ParB N-terminal domain-containing protein, partial [Spirochaetota bacterium]
MNAITEIELSMIEPHPANRKHGGFDPEKLKNLADSIRTVGVQQPVVVRPMPDGRYQLVAGERRWRA